MRVPRGAFWNGWSWHHSSSKWPAKRSKAYPILLWREVIYIYIYFGVGEPLKSGPVADAPRSRPRAWRRRTSAVSSQCRFGCTSRTSNQQDRTEACARLQPLLCTRLMNDQLLCFSLLRCSVLVGLKLVNSSYQPVKQTRPYDNPLGCTSGSLMFIITLHYIPLECRAQAVASLSLARQVRQILPGAKFTNPFTAHARKGRITLPWTFPAKTVLQPAEHFGSVIARDQNL